MPRAAAHRGRAQPGGRPGGRGAVGPPAVGVAGRGDVLRRHGGLAGLAEPPEPLLRRPGACRRPRRARGPGPAVGESAGPPRRGGRAGPPPRRRLGRRTGCAAAERARAGGRPPGRLRGARLGAEQQPGEPHRAARGGARMGIATGHRRWPGPPGRRSAGRGLPDRRGGRRRGIGRAPARSPGGRRRGDRRGGGSPRRAGVLGGREPPARWLHPPRGAHRRARRE